VSDEAGIHAIELAGRRFAWRTLGSGPALLLVNGYAASSADWDPTLLDALARSFRIVCPDNRGTGDSELGDPDQLSADAMAEDLEGLLDQLHIEQAPVVGWSMGGFVAQRLATRSPRRVRALVLLASAPGGPAGAPAEPHVLAQLTDHSGTPREQATRLISLLFPPAVAVEVDLRFGAIVAAARAQLSPATLAAQERVLAAWSSEAQPAPGPDAPPMLAICGEQDIVIPPRNSDALAELWAGARVEQMPDGGHAFMAQQPERVARMIVSFLAPLIAG
jgi:pimeloyl-ACP methyl ester carboxylesterase